MANAAVAIVALMCAIIVLLPPPAGSVRFQFEEEDMATEEALSALYQRWAAHHRVARDVAETARRFDIFKDKVRRIHAFNKQGNARFFLSLNQFGDMTEAEVDNTYSDCSIAYGESDGAWPTSTPTDASRVLLLPPPEQVDWRQKGVVTAVKNQGVCRACWAFAAIAAVESLTAIKTGKLYDLSEQALIDCADPPNEGCNGGLAAEALRFMSLQGRQSGAFREDAYPYRLGDSTSGTCAVGHLRPQVRYQGFRMVFPRDDTTTLMRAVAAQPVAVRITANGTDFNNYAGGIFTGQCTTQLGHAVVVVGYGTEHGDPYWIVKNSWGDGWGEEGYIRMSRVAGDEDTGGLCGILAEPSYPVWA